MEYNTNYKKIIKSIKEGIDRQPSYSKPPLDIKVKEEICLYIDNMYEHYEIEEAAEMLRLFVKKFIKRNKPPDNFSFLSIAIKKRSYQRKN